MRIKKRRSATKAKPTRAMVLAAGRNVLAAIACWMSLIFDAGAAKRLAQRGWPTDLNVFTSEVKDYIESGAVGSQIETSTTLANLGRAYDFVESGHWLGTSEQLEALICDFTPLGVFLESEQLCDQMGTSMIDLAAKQYVLEVMRAADARWTLFRERSVDLPQMALLSGLTEKTIRMAAIRRRQGGQELPTYKDGPRTLVHAKDAMRWLGKRPDFRPTQIAGIGASESFEPKSALQLGALLEALRSKAGLTSEEVTEQLGLKGAYAGSYDELEGGWWDAPSIDVSLFDVEGIMKLAEVLRVKKRNAFVRAMAEFMAPYRIERQLAMQYGRAKKGAVS